MKIKLNDKFKGLFSSNTRYTIITGGRGSAKSFSVGVFLTLLTFQENEKILFTRKTLTSAHLSIIPEFLEKIELMGLESKFDIMRTTITNTHTGSQIIFRGLQSSSRDNTANLKSLQGVTAWVLDEAEELTDESTFDRIDFSIRKKEQQNRVILIMNPATKEHFIYNRFFSENGINAGFNGQTENCTYIHTTYLDNAKNLNRSFIEQAKRMKKNNPNKYNHIMLGGWLEKAEGVIFTNWKIGDFKDNGNTIFGQDYGFSIDPTTLVEVSIFKSLKQIYLKEHLYKSKLSTTEIAKINNNIAKDRLIVGDSAEPRLISELTKKGNNIIPAIKGQGSITAGIAILQDYEIIVDQESKNIIKELNNYVWSDKRKSTPVDNYNHIIDAVRYAVQHQITNSKKTSSVWHG